MNTSIRTTYHAPTPRKGPRITATATDGRKCTIPMLLNHLSQKDHHQAAADALCDKLGWDKSRLIGGELSDGYVFVFREGVEA